MAKFKPAVALFPAILAALLFTAGCATTDQRVNLHYEPSVPATGGSGELYLAKGEDQPLAPKNQAGEWILGDIINKDGKNLGRAVIGISPTDLMQQAFTAEFRRAGYTVVPAKTLPGDVAKGIALSSVKITLKEVSGPDQAVARGDVKVSVALRRNGKMLATLNYATVYDDTATTDRDRLLPNTLQRSLLFVMRQALSEIIGLLEKQ